MALRYQGPGMPGRGWPVPAGTASWDGRLLVGRGHGMAQLEAPRAGWPTHPVASLTGASLKGM